MILKTLWSLVLALFLLITPMTEPKSADTQEAVIINEKLFGLNEALSMGQGITTDGKYFYTSGAATDFFGYTALSKIDMNTMKRVDVNIFALPGELSRRGNNHIGGISYYDGKIYAPTEDDARNYPCICVFDAATLKYITHFEVDSTLLPDGVPWCAVDGQNNVLYTSSFDNADTILMFRLDTMEYIDSVKLSSPVDRVQGGECYGSKLYISTDTERDTNIKSVYEINPETGAVNLAFTRNVGKAGSEAEGMTVYELNGETVFSVLDFNKSGGVYIRSYSLCK